MNVPLSQEFYFLPKTGRPASFGTLDGPFPFFTSSQDVSKRTDAADCLGPALVFGTGGAASIHYVEGEFSATNDCYVAVPRSGKATDAKYFYHYLRTHIQLIESGFRGAGLKHVSKKHLEAIHLPAQKDVDREQINAILDKAYDICRKREQALVLMDEFLMSVFLEIFGDPVANTKNWPMRTLGLVCTKITDGTHDTPPRQSSGVMFITGKNIRPFRIDTENLEFVSEDVHREIYRRCNPEYGDVLYTNIGAGTGNASFNEFNFEFSMKNVALLKPSQELVNGRFLEFILNNDRFKQRLIARYGQGGAQGFLGLKTIKSIEIPLPPIGPQTRFYEIVSRAKTASARIKLAYASDESLFLSLSQRAFRGET